VIIRPFEKIHKISRRESEKGIILDTDLDRYDLNHFIQNWTEWSDYKETQIHVAEDDGDVIGFIMYGRIRTRPDFDKGVVPRFGAEVYALYVHPNHFRKNVGKALFLKAIEHLIDLKLTSLLLWALKKNKRACTFYESFGGERISKKKVEMGERSWAEESCFAWRNIKTIPK